MNEGLTEGDRDCEGPRLGVLVLANVEMKEGCSDGVLVVCRRDGKAIIVGVLVGRRLVGMFVGRDDLEGLSVLV